MNLKHLKLGEPCEVTRKIILNVHNQSKLNSINDDITSELIYNFYSLYFSHQNLFCSRVPKSKFVNKEQTKTKIQKNKSISLVGRIMTRVKKFFSIGKKRKVKSFVNEEIILKLVEQSRVNQLELAEEDFMFEFPGYSDIEIQNFLLIWNQSLKYTCPFCEEEEELVKLLLQKDVINKIFAVLELTRDSIQEIARNVIQEEDFVNEKASWSEIHIGPDNNIHEEVKVKKNNFFKSKKNDLPQLTKSKINVNYNSVENFKLIKKRKMMLPSDEYLDEAPMFQSNRKIKHNNFMNNSER